MAKDLSLQTGVDNTDSDYLNGKIVDGVTEIGEGINQDIIQFFQKLMDDAGFSPSGDADNEANGYEFVSALLVKISDIATPIIDAAVPLAITQNTITNWDMNADSTKSVAHGLSATEYMNIKTITVLIQNDDEDDLKPLTSTSTADRTLPNGSIDNIDSTNINLFRASGNGDFDSTDYESVSGFVRGWISIQYIAD